jgi:hypothetical protein
MEALVSLGVDGMFTNFPARLEQVLGEYAANGKTAAKEAPGHEACRAGLCAGLVAGNSGRVSARRPPAFRAS